MDITWLWDITVIIDIYHGSGISQSRETLHRLVATLEKVLSKLILITWQIPQDLLLFPVSRQPEVPKTTGFFQKSNCHHGDINPFVAMTTYFPNYDIPTHISL